MGGLAVRQSEVRGGEQSGGAIRGEHGAKQAAGGRGAVIKGQKKRGRCTNKLRERKTEKGNKKKPTKTKWRFI